MLARSVITFSKSGVFRIIRIGFVGGHGNGHCHTSTDCDATLFCKDWCPSKKQFIIMDRDWDRSTDRRRIPIEHFEQDVRRGPPTSEGTSREYPRWHETYYEYPSNPERPFNYGNQTNNRTTTEDRGYARAITTSDKTLMGVSRHPVGDPKKLDCLDEVVESKVPFMEKEVRYPKNCDGKPETIKHVPKKR